MTQECGLAVKMVVPPLAYPFWVSIETSHACLIYSYVVLFRPKKIPNLVLG